MASGGVLSSTAAASPSSDPSLWGLPPTPPADSLHVPFITVEEPPSPSPSTSPVPPEPPALDAARLSAVVAVARPAAGRQPVAPRPSPRVSHPEGADRPMSVALDGPNPSPHFVSLENIARLYIELKNDRDYLVEESSRIFRERVEVVRELRDLEATLNELIQRKARLEESLDQLGLRDEGNRTQMAVVDDKVSSIANESARFEATVRELKGPTVATVSSAVPAIAAAAQPPADACQRHARHQQHSPPIGALPAAATPAAPRAKPSAACKRTMYGHTGNVMGLDVCQATSVLISASSDRSLRTWDASSGRRLDTLYGHEGWVHAVAFSSAGQRAVSGAGDKTVKVWDLGDARGRGSCRTTISGHDAGVTCVQLDDDNVLVSGSLDKTLRRYDLSDNAQGNCTVIQGHEQGVYCLQFVRHGLASGGGDSLIRMHDMRSGLCHRTLSGHSAGAVRALQFDDVQLVSGGADAMLRFWDLRTGGETGSVEAGARINAIHVDAGRVIVACGSHTVKVYDSQSMALVAEHAGHLGPVLSLAGYGDVFFTGSTDQTCKVWSLPARAPTPPPEAPPAAPLPSTTEGASTLRRPDTPGLASGRT
jgi:WD40 repeat protein